MRRAGRFGSGSRYVEASRGVLGNQRMKGKLAAAIAFLAVACGSAAGGGAVVGSPLTIDQLKFKVMDSVGVPLFCDPDFYPIARLCREQASPDTYYPQLHATTP